MIYYEVLERRHAVDIAAATSLRQRRHAAVTMLSTYR